MPQTQPIQARLQDASALPDTLAVSFDAFEAIRLAARSCTDRVPELFAAFMTTADAAVDGREAITAAPSLPAGPAAAQPGLLAPGGSVDDALGHPRCPRGTPGRRLTQAAAAATIPADRAACERGCGRGAADPPADGPW